MFDTKNDSYNTWKSKVKNCCEQIKAASSNDERNRRWSELYQLSHKSSQWGLTVEDFNSFVNEHLNEEDDAE